MGSDNGLGVDAGVPLLADAGVADQARSPSLPPFA
jgi:hypothetical protein